MPASATQSDYPVMKYIGDQSVDENSSLIFTISGIDPEGDLLEYTASGIPDGAGLNNQTGRFEWTPSYEQQGIYLLQFTVSDGQFSDSENITITVNDVNRLPEFSSISNITVYENEQLQLSLEATDPDGDSVFFSKETEYGSLKGNVFTWTPGYDDQGSHILVFTANDSHSSVSRSVTIKVSNTNREPVLYSISDMSVSVSEPVTIQLEATDPDGDKLTYSNVSVMPEGATLDSDKGIFHWNNSRSEDSYYLEFSVSDGSSSDTKSVQIIAGNSNTPPSLSIVEPQYVTENSEVSFAITASDEQDHRFSFSYPENLPAGASLSMSDDTIYFTWTPTYEQAGEYRLEFGVSDNSRYRYTSYEVVEIYVSNLNRPPVIDTIAGSSVTENDLLVINLSASDPDGDSLTFSTDSSKGSVIGNSFIFIPGYTDQGVYDLSFTVSDGMSSDSSTATINVINRNMPPRLNPIDPVQAVTGEKLAFDLSVTDIDGNDTHSYKALDVPESSDFNESTGHFSWTPSSDETGYYSLDFYVTDGVDEDYETVIINVTEESSSSNESSSSSSGSGGGGGSGGSAGDSGEKYENILLADYSLKSVMRDTDTVFSFKDEDDIVSVTFKSKINAGQVKTVVEILKAVSTQVDSEAPGKVYRNLNIYTDSNMPSESLGEPRIRFKVDKNWAEQNDINISAIFLCHYSNGEWTQLSTAQEDEDNNYYYFTATSPGLFQFAISSVDNTKQIETAARSAVSIPGSTEDGLMSTEDSDLKELAVSASSQSRSAFGFVFILLLAGIGIIYWALRIE